MKARIVAGLVLALGTFDPAAARACSCAMEPTLVASSKTADFVFIGELVRREDGVATVHVKERFKGRVPKRVSVLPSVVEECPTIAGFGYFGRRGTT